MAAAHARGRRWHARRRSGAPYGSDLRLLTGSPASRRCTTDPATPRLAHAPDERVPLAEVHTAARALALLALDVCGTA